MLVEEKILTNSMIVVLVTVTVAVMIEMFAEHSDETVIVVSLISAAFATVCNISIEASGKI